jgi:hypothetical protein
LARNLAIYPKATLVGDQWRFVVNVWGDGPRSKFEHIETAGVTAEVPLTLLKLAYDLTVGDTDTNADVDDAHYVDTASGGPTNGETLWESWRELAESIINAARRILVNGRGWTVGSVHQHEGDNTVTEEV